MVVFPNCKINLGLQILGKRPDGYHDLQTVFLPVPLQDVLEVIQNPGGATQLTISGITIDAQAEDNICVKAYRLLQQHFPDLPPVQIHLHKAIPSGAGLGGGSADGAFMLMLLNQKFNLKLSQEQLITLALQLGSDCPFFILNQACYATGRGEQMQPITLDISAYKLVLVNPGIHINTGWAFRQLLSNRKQLNLQEAIRQPVTAWKNVLVNDFEEPVFAAFPEIAVIKDKLYAAGAVFASMTGTGATVFGLFPGTTDLATLSFPDSYFVWQQGN